MSPGAGHSSIRCSNVEISGTGISELDCRGTATTVPREQVRRITLSYDTRTENPFCHYFLGFTLLLLGALGLLVIFLASVKGGLIQVESEYMEIPLIPVALWLMIGIGLWLLVGIFRAQYHFLIETENKTCRIFFEKSADIAEIRQFIRRAQFDFGYEIDISILEKLQGSL